MGLLKAPRLPLVRLFGVTYKISKIRFFFRKPMVTLGLRLGDDLVTIRVTEHPWGPYSLSHALFQSFIIALM